MLQNGILLQFNGMVQNLFWGAAPDPHSHIPAIPLHNSLPPQAFVSHSEMWPGLRESCLFTSEILSHQ